MSSWERFVHKNSGLILSLYNEGAFDDVHIQEIEAAGLRLRSNGEDGGTA